MFTPGLFRNPGILSLLLCLAGSLSAQDVDQARQALAQAELFNRSPSASMVLSLEIIEGSSKKYRELKVFSRSQGSARRMLVKVAAPASLAGLSFLRIVPESGKGQSWLKTSRGVRRVASGSNDGERLFGSDFTVADFANDHDDWASIELGPASSGETITVTARAKDGHGVRYVIEQSDYLISAASYFDAAGKETKHYKVEEWKVQGGQRHPARATMVDLVRNSRTTVRVVAMDPLAPFPDIIFNPASM